MSGTALTEVQLHQLGDKPRLFQKGHPRYGGRPKGSRNKFGGDLREAIVAAINATGFIEKDDKGNLVPTGKRGWVSTWQGMQTASVPAGCSTCRKS
jgi:hypothetical protein